MDYQFENLGPERFQQFCQALLVKEFPDVQCYPVAQPDGGRDAATYFYLEKDTKGLIVFQVKFVRRPFAEADPHRWLTDIMGEEAPKVKRLIQKGTTGYYLLTNIAGTAHLDSGSIDKVNKLLGDILEIPSQCWWRDDLSRRLDSAWNLKWAYPELMTGMDMLHYIFESGLSEHKERRTAAIKSFVRAQYDTDQEVRFKQIELKNQLLDLFIDVPVRYSRGREDRRHFISQLILLSQSEVEKAESERTSEVDFDPFDVETSSSSEEPQSVGAATMLLYPLVQDFIPQIVLEGAPGQGKSTIAQFICQVHRMYILGEKSDLAAIPKLLKPTSIRIPFKVDLRDLATWLNKQDPFSSDESFPENTYPRYELISITKPLINEYAKKWIKARKLNSRDSADVKRILKEKLDQPHLRDLARNPMQLAILLSLIHARGSSLPDKRTALYDSYVELFFSRESDKSPVVREHRDLLIDIHRYLAWVLHSEAEQGHNRGSGLHPCDHSTAKVNISQPVLYTTAKSEQGDATCEADHIVEN